MKNKIDIILITLTLILILIDIISGSENIIYFKIMACLGWMGFLMSQLKHGN